MIEDYNEINKCDLIKEYLELIIWLRKNNLLNSKSLLKGKQFIEPNLRKVALQKIYKFTEFLPEKTSHISRLKYIKNHVNEKNAFCPVCGDIRILKNGRILYTCGKKDSEHQIKLNKITQNRARLGSLIKYGKTNPLGSKIIQEKVKRTNLKKYGVSNPGGLSEIQEKIKQTNLERYGVENPSQNKKIRQKQKDTCLKRYGTKSPMQNKEICLKSRNTHKKNTGFDSPLQNPKSKKKFIQTNIKRYGVSYPMQNKIIAEKAKNTSLLRYGAKNPASSKEIKDKILSTNFKKYGVSNPSKLETTKEKVRQTNLKRYGVEYPIQLKSFKTKRNRITLENNRLKYGVDSPQQSHYNYNNFKKLNTEFIQENFIDKEGYVLKVKFQKFIGCSSTSVFNFFRKFDINYKPRNNKSEPEYQIIDLLELAVPEIEIVHGSRQIIKPLELDIYLPEYRLAIEFNGSLYHSAGKDNWSAVDNTLEEIQNKHAVKTKACQDKGIELIHIPEWWWNYDREYWERLVLSKIGVDELQKSSELLSSYELLGSNHPVILPELYSPLEWTQETLEQLIEEGKRVYFH